MTVTWLIHDVEPWRVDRIYLLGEGAPWIATQVMEGTGTIWDSPVVWHQPADGAALTRLLDRLGVGLAAGAGGDDAPDGAAGGAVGSSGSGAGPDDAPAPPADATAEPAANAPVSGADDARPLNGARWGFGGLLAGLLLAAAWVRLRPRRADLTDDPGDDEWPAGATVDRLAPASRT